MKRGLLLLAGAALHACTTDLGEMPALCPDGECPEGYDCIQGVCALPGSSVPARVTEIGNLRGPDLRVVPMTDSALIVWETYPYSDRGQAVRARRIFADGSSSTSDLVLDATWQADSGAVEPFFDVLPISDTQLLVAISSSPLDEGSDPRPRIGVFDVTIPSVNDGADASNVTSSFAWESEIRMSTIGYGNVSQPRFAIVSGSQKIQLGYFEGIVDEDGTRGRLAVFDLAQNGSLPSEPPACKLVDPACCSGNACYVSLRKEAVAAGLSAVFVDGEAITWAVDETRPSCIRPTEAIDPDPPVVDEAPLLDLGVPLFVDEDAVVFLVPSERADEAVPDGSITGSATLWRQTFSDTDDPPAPEKIADLVAVRDTPRPAWIRTASSTGLLITSGDEVTSPDLHVLHLSADGSFEEIATIPRRSGLPLGSIQAALVGTKLYVAWLDLADQTAIVRATVLDVP